MALGNDINSRQISNAVLLCQISALSGSTKLMLAGLRGISNGDSGKHPSGMIRAANIKSPVPDQEWLLHEWFDEVVRWEYFRPRLEAALRKPVGERKSPAGRKPWDAVVMFKAIVLCELYNLSDDQVEYQLRDRLNRTGFAGGCLV